MTGGTSSETSPADPGRPSLWRDAWRRLACNRPAAASAAFLAGLAFACALGPWLVPESFASGDFAQKLRAPDLVHWFGTDQLGRDLLVRVLLGGRVSLAVGLCATVVSLTIGLAWGAVAGFAGGKLDALMMRIVDILYALPFTVLVILLMVFSHELANAWNLGATWNMLILFAAIGAVEWLTMARIVRAQVRGLRRQEFIEATFVLGFSRARIILRHMLPNVAGPVIVYTTLTIPAVMLLEAFLSFLGLGIRPPMSSWGTLLKEGAEQMEDFWWLLAFPAGFFSLTLLSLNFLGDGLRDALDVRTSRD